MVTGRPLIAPKISMKSALCISRNRSSARVNSSSASVRARLRVALLAPAAPELAGDEHVSDQLLSVRAEEHVLSPAEADPLRAELARPRSILGRVGVGPNSEAPDFVRPAQDRREVLADLWLDQAHVVGGHHPGRPVDRDRVSGMKLACPRRARHLRRGRSRDRMRRRHRDAPCLGRRLRRARTFRPARSALPWPHGTLRRRRQR